MQQYGLVVLAAGNSSRLGEPKQLLEYKNKNLLQHAVSVALQVTGAAAAVVIGADKERMQQQLSNYTGSIFINDHWQQGMSSSIEVGLTGLTAMIPSMKACIFTVCDQPFITPELLKQLITVHETTRKGIVASTYAGIAGTPVLFSAAYFEELKKLQKDQGAKQLLQQYFNDLATVTFYKGEIDIDTPDDYKKLLDADRQL